MQQQFQALGLSASAPALSGAPEGRSLAKQVGESMTSVARSALSRRLSGLRRMGDTASQLIS